MSFAPGQTVRISSRPHLGHHRTPGYLKGKRGTVARLHGRFTNPETRAYGSDGEPEQQLYLVSFSLHDVSAGYRGSTEDRVLADIFEHWLEDAE